MMAGLYIVLARGNLVKKMIGLNVFQTSVFLFYISMGKVLHGTAPIQVGGHAEDYGNGHAPNPDLAAKETDGAISGASDGAIDGAAGGVSAASGAHDAVHEVIYSNPLPHVLILTAIVVGVSTLAVGLAIIVRIREAYGTIEEDEIVAADHAAEFGEAARRS